MKTIQDINSRIMEAVKNFAERRQNKEREVFIIDRNTNPEIYKGVTSKLDPSLSTNDVIGIPLQRKTLRTVQYVGNIMIVREVNVSEKIYEPNLTPVSFVESIYKRTDDGDNLDVRTQATRHYQDPATWMMVEHGVQETIRLDQLFADDAVDFLLDGEEPAVLMTAEETTACTLASA